MGRASEIIKEQERQRQAQADAQETASRLETMEELLTNIVMNARLQPDASMGGTTDTYAVPLDDITAAAAFLGIEVGDKS